MNFEHQDLKTAADGLAAVENCSAAEIINSDYSKMVNCIAVDTLKLWIRVSESPSSSSISRSESVVLVQ